MGICLAIGLAIGDVSVGDAVVVRLTVTWRTIASRPFGVALSVESLLNWGR